MWLLHCWMQINLSTRPIHKHILYNIWCDYKRSIQRVHFMFCCEICDGSFCIIKSAATHSFNVVAGHENIQQISEIHYQPLTKIAAPVDNAWWMACDTSTVAGCQLQPIKIVTFRRKSSRVKPTSGSEYFTMIVKGRKGKEEYILLLEEKETPKHSPYCFSYRSCTSIRNQTIPQFFAITMKNNQLGK